MGFGDSLWQVVGSRAGSAGIGTVDATLTDVARAGEHSHSLSSAVGVVMTASNSSDSGVGAPPSAWRRRLLIPARAKPGMRLLVDVRLANGATLLPAGTVLDAQALQRLIQRQVEVIVVAEPDERTSEQVTVDAQAVDMRVEHIFRGPSTPARELLKESVMAHRLASVMPCPPEL